MTRLRQYQFLLKYSSVRIYERAGVIVLGASRSGGRQRRESHGKKNEVGCLENGDDLWLAMNKLCGDVLYSMVNILYIKYDVRSTTTILHHKVEPSICRYQSRDYLSAIRPFTQYTGHSEKEMARML